MSRFDLLRRTAAVLAVVLCLLAVTGVAQAKFTSTTSALLQVGVRTATLVAPSEVSGTYRCNQNHSEERVNFTVDSFTDGGPEGSTYLFELSKNESPAVLTSVTSTRRSATVESPSTQPGPETIKWTLSIYAVQSSWTSPAKVITVSCLKNGNTFFTA